MKLPVFSVIPLSPVSHYLPYFSGLLTDTVMQHSSLAPEKEHNTSQTFVAMPEDKYCNVDR